MVNMLDVDLPSFDQFLPLTSCANIKNGSLGTEISKYFFETLISSLSAS